MRCLVGVGMRVRDKFDRCWFFEKMSRDKGRKSRNLICRRVWSGFMKGFGGRGLFPRVRGRVINAKETTKSNRRGRIGGVLFGRWRWGENSRESRVKLRLSCFMRFCRLATENNAHRERQSVISDSLPFTSAPRRHTSVCLC